MPSNFKNYRDIVSNVGTNMVGKEKTSRVAVFFSQRLFEIFRNLEFLGIRCGTMVLRTSTIQHHDHYYYYFFNKER